MNRRNLLISAASIAGAGGLVWLLAKAGNLPMPGMSDMDMGKMDMNGMDGGATGVGERISELPVGKPLPEFSRLANKSTASGVFEATLEAGPSQREFAPGIKTEVLAYNGSVPGSMIEVTEGDKFKVTFRNLIEEQESTIHWHGLEVPPDQDGNPTHAVASGASRIYEFTIPEGSAGSYWYHPHPHGKTGEQVYRGLAAPFIVKSKSDPLPPELGDTTLFISTISLNADGAIAKNTAPDMWNGREGDHVLVNGTKQPVLTLAPGSSRRFRFFNATNGRFLKLSFEGHNMTLVGTDGGLLAGPVTDVREILLAPAERAEVVVEFQFEEGPVRLVSTPHERGWMGGNKPASETLTLMTFDLKGPISSRVALPQKLREIAELGRPAATKRIEISETMGMANGGMTMGFLLDGKTFDMNRVDLTSKLGDVELWEIANKADMDHPFHIHGGQFQIVEREKDGKVVASPYLAWKDTVNIAQGETIRLKMRQAMAGKRMYHCHILEHEDQGMMGTLEVA